MELRQIFHNVVFNAIWDTLKLIWAGSPAFVKTLIIVIFPIIVIAIVSIVIMRKYKLPTGEIIIYPNRTDIPDLTEQLQGVHDVWFVNISPKILTTLPTDQFIKIKKCIFVHPNSSIFSAYQRMFGVSASLFRENAIGAARRCTQYHIPSRWTEDPVHVIVFGDPESASGWIRVQWFVPYLHGHLQPISMITKRNHSQFFNRLKDAFLELEKNSRELDRDSIDEIEGIS